MTENPSDAAGEFIPIVVSRGMIPSLHRAPPTPGSGLSAAEGNSPSVSGRFRATRLRPLRLAPGSIVRCPVVRPEFNVPEARP